MSSRTGGSSSVASRKDVASATCVRSQSLALQKINRCLVRKIRSGADQKIGRKRMMFVSNTSSPSTERAVTAGSFTAWLGGKIDDHELPGLGIEDGHESLLFC